MTVVWVVLPSSLVSNYKTLQLKRP